MKLSRRECLRQLGLAPLLPLAAGATANCLAAAPTPALALFDARWPASLTHAETAAACIETGLERVTRWFELRHAALRPGDRVVGLTAWSDWTVARGLLSERGLRVQREVRRPDGLFEWAMA